ncbi:MAG: hypothetical protein HIU92_02545 [Proteobacteria bacterium]|nr:hypothetical protein [Pseudomonadota bacterium]
MSTRKKGGASHSARAQSAGATPPLPPRPTPAPTAESRAQEAEISRMIRELAQSVTETNLLRTRRLVDMALRGQVPQELIDHLSLIGRDYYKLAEQGPQKPTLRVIEGGDR